MQGMPHKSQPRARLCVCVGVAGSVMKGACTEHRAAAAADLRRARCCAARQLYPGLPAHVHVGLVVPKLLVHCQSPVHPDGASVTRIQGRVAAGGDELCSDIDWQADVAKGTSGRVAWEVKLPEGVAGETWTPAELGTVLAMDFEPHMAPHVIMPYSHFPTYAIIYAEPPVLPRAHLPRGKQNGRRSSCLAPLSCRVALPPGPLLYVARTRHVRAPKPAHDSPVGGHGCPSKPLLISADNTSAREALRQSPFASC